jgi:glycosyltransferase involved in cell wall biosynthesis
MRCPRLAELPPPPAGKSGWPWTAETPALPPAPPDGGPFPRISIVSPSFNQGQFIEQTIRSVLLQGYPDLEYIIVDGGSTDASVEIISKYGPWLSYCVSEADGGQTNAINKGLSKSTGLIFNWLNTDDFLLIGALGIVAKQWIRGEYDIFTAGAQFVDAVTNAPIYGWEPQPPRTLDDFILPGQVLMAQPSTFLSRTLIDDLGRFHEHLVCTMDYEFYFRAFKQLGEALRIAIAQDVISYIGVHPAAKSSRLSELFGREWRSVLIESTAAFSSRGASQLLKDVNDHILQTVLHSPMNDDRLLRIVFEHPGLLGKRYYWGKLRQKLESQLLRSCGTRKT